LWTRARWHARVLGHRLRGELGRSPWPTTEVADPRPAVVTASYRDLPQLVQLLVTLLRVPPAGALHSVLVVDAGASDEERAVLRALGEAGVIRHLERDRRTGHGAALNAGISAIGDAVKAGAPAPAYLWLLDSDVLVLRADVVAAAVGAMERGRAALIGQLQQDVLAEVGGYAHVSSVMLDPRVVWRRNVPPFFEDGTPGVEQQRRLRKLGLPVFDFPFYRDRYLLHLGQGALRGIADRQEIDHPLYEWAVETYEIHYHDNPEGAEIHARVKAQIDREAPALDPASVVAACSRAERIKPFLGHDFERRLE
jgi:glycosyltransferase involved in cell wall biosynthesis